MLLRTRSRSCEAAVAMSAEREAAKADRLRPAPSPARVARAHPLPCYSTLDWHQRWHAIACRSSAPLQATAPHCSHLSIPARLAQASSCLATPQPLCALLPIPPLTRSSHAPTHTPPRSTRVHSHSAATPPVLASLLVSPLPSLRLPVALIPPAPRSGSWSTGAAGSHRPRSSWTAGARSRAGAAVRRAQAAEAGEVECMREEGPAAGGVRCWRRCVCSTLRTLGAIHDTTMDELTHTHRTHARWLPPSPAHPPPLMALPNPINPHHACAPCNIRPHAL